METRVFSAEKGDGFAFCTDIPLSFQQTQGHEYLTDMAYDHRKLIHVWEHAWTPSGGDASRHAPLRMSTTDRRKEAWAGRADARMLSNRFGELLKAYFF